MTTKIPCYIEFTDTGKYARLVHKSGMTIAEFLIYDTNFMHRALHAYDRFGLKDIPRPNQPYRAAVEEIIEVSEINEEVKALLDVVDEMIQSSEKLELEKEIEDQKYGNLTED